MLHLLAQAFGLLPVLKYLAREPLQGWHAAGPRMGQGKELEMTARRKRNPDRSVCKLGSNGCVKETPAIVRLIESRDQVIRNLFVRRYAAQGSM
jgi:hypothetical protein